MERSAGQEGDLAITIEDAERVRAVIAFDVEDDVSHAWRQCDPILSSRLVDGREHLLNVFGVIVTAGLVVLLDDLGHRRRRGATRFEHQSVLEPGGVRAGELGRRLGCCRFVRWQRRRRRDRHGVVTVVGTAASDGADDGEEQQEHEECVAHGGFPPRDYLLHPGSWVRGARQKLPSILGTNIPTMLSS